MIKIEDTWYKEIPKADYPAYVQACKAKKIPLSFKVHNGKVVYKVISDLEILKVTSTNKPVFLTLSGEIQKPVKKLTNLGKFDGEILGNRLYQYCDTCAETQPHSLHYDKVICNTCRNMYAVLN